MRYSVFYLLVVKKNFLKKYHLEVNKNGGGV